MVASSGNRALQASLARWIPTLKEHRRIIAAILLQDMQTRFGRGYLSYILAIGWPFSHAVFLLVGYLLVNRLAPIGDDPAIFAMTGVVPYILCFYSGRTMPTIYLLNKQMLNLPVVRSFHIISSAIVIELLTGIIVLFLISCGALLVGIDIFPYNSEAACAALLATLYLGIGLGVFNIMCASVLGQFYIVFYILVMVGLYITSAVYVPNWMISGSTRAYLVYNPVFNLVEWLRSAYYASYDPYLINKSMVLGVATGALFLGLLGERFLRNKFYVS